ncbi:MAG: pentapeptide repeat-containing protein [Rubrobacter sp.]
MTKRNTSQEERSKADGEPKLGRGVILWLGLLGGLLILLAWLGYGYPWTGFGERSVASAEDETVIPAKTLWDWLNILVVPLALAAGGVWLNKVYRDRERDAEIQQRKRDREAQEARRQRELEIEASRSQHSVLESYLDRMSELLLEGELRASEADSEVRIVARARTITALGRLDGDRKAILLRFLYEADLINRDSAVISLDGADFRGADLYGFKLTDADLRGADFSSANLSHADLSGSDLVWAKFRRANLQKARFKNSQMTATTLRRANLACAYLEGANLTNSVLPRADLTRARLSGAILRGATNLDRCVMRETDLTGADLSGARLFGADLRGAYLSGAALDRTRFVVHRTERLNMEVNEEEKVRMEMEDEDLINEDLTDADLTGVVLDDTCPVETRISDKQLSSCSSLKNAVLPAKSGLMEDEPEWMPRRET